MNNPDGNTPTADSANNTALTGVVSAGLNTTAFPAANAGATRATANSNGCVHDATCAHTPIGSRRANDVHPGTYSPAAPASCNRAAPA
ncbi:hypothetical protein GCM10020366_31350 [Saccharopolyspora gregorii]|uniref:Uncharacterized protein n=1 Tax=Saccharopolyspora gregorii TaxID=33914 RepID=A0ABP6RS62_9PSEU